MLNSSLKILSQCVDTLVLNCYPTDIDHKVERRGLPLVLCEELKQLKEKAQEIEGPVPTRFIFKEARFTEPYDKGTNLKMMDKGGTGFNWILKNDLITLAINRSSKMLLWAQVRLSSQYLQTRRNLGYAISDVHLFLVSIFGDLITLQPSSIDLAVDVLNFDIGTIHDVKKHFVSRAQLTGEMPEHFMIDGPDQIKERWGRLTGLPFGARKAPLSALIYDKTHEIKYNSPEKGYMWDIWQHEAEKQGFCLLRSAKVWRIEIRYKREALGQMMQDGVFHGIDDAYALENHIPGLWSYAVGHATGGADGLPDGWLRYVNPSSDTNRSRWPVHASWQVIQSAFIPQPLEETEYDRQAHIREREQEELLQDLDDYLIAVPLAPKQLTVGGLQQVVEVITSSGEEKEVLILSPLEPASFVAYARKRKRTVNLGRLVAQITGCTVTLEAWRRPANNDVGADLSDTFHFLYKEAQNYLDRKERDFDESVNKKRMLYDLGQQLSNFDAEIAS